jgi:hypothetical protein
MGTTQMNWRRNAGHDPNHLAEPPRFNTEPVTIRVTNGSGKTVDLVGTATVTYGPDGQEAKNQLRR